MTKLANYAVHQTIGRNFPESAPTDRNDFQRDRARIVHSAAFRRLEYKTQVFVNHQADLYRTRLTHSIEVAQIARSVARNLHLNEDLTEAIALAHDLGHTPFGHAGQDRLNKCMQNYGGFEHNLQSLRIVEKLEERYANFPGLNLCFETKEGILKHCSLKNAKLLGALGQRFLLNQRPSLEAQLVDVADALAYNNHDVDDGLRSGLLSLEQMQQHYLFNRCFVELQIKYPQANSRIIIHETVRMMINLQIQDLLTNSRQQINDLPNLSAVKTSPILLKFSPAMNKLHLELKTLLRHNLYQHPTIVTMTQLAGEIISELFDYYYQRPELLPPMHYSVIEFDNSSKVARAVADYIAGMTDRFAEKTWQELPKSKINKS